MKIRLTVNGRSCVIETPPLRRLLDLLRVDLGLTGSKEGCGEGECGACAVLLDGLLVDACLVPALQLDGRSVRTIEGLGTEANPDPVQQAFLEEGAVQCGFCIPGMVMASRALLDLNPQPGDHDIREGLAGNLCRCTGYEKIVRAVERAARTPRSAGWWSAGEVPGSVQPHALAVAATRTSDATSSAASLLPDIPQVHLPRSLSEALEILGRHGRQLTLIAGATDFLTGLELGQPAPAQVMDLMSLSELQKIKKEGGIITIGAGVTLSRILSSPVVAEALPLLHQAAAQFGAPAIRNRATVGGNLLSASPAGDLPPALLALEAKAVLLSSNGRREVPLESFFPAYRRTACREDELLGQVIIPIPSPKERQVFAKVGPRRAQAIAKVSLAARGYQDGQGRIADCRLAAGSVGPTVVLLEKTRGLVLGRKPTTELAQEAGQVAATEVQTIDDVRSSAHYRRTVLGRLVTRFFQEDWGI